MVIGSDDGEGNLRAIKQIMRTVFARLPSVLSRLFTKAFLNARNLPGVFWALRVRFLGRKVIFADKFGFRWWQYPSDPLAQNWARQSIGDSDGVRSFVLRHVQREQVCIDVGACYGSISVPLWSRVGENGKVISVEADPAKIFRVRENLSLNGFSTQHVVNVAISDREESRRLRCYPKAPGWNTFGDPAFASNYQSFMIDVQAVSFQRLCQNEGLTIIDLVKIDAEGAELLILQGMRPLLELKSVGCVIFEVNPLMLPGCGTTPEALLSFWRGLEYKLYHINPYGNTEPLVQLVWPGGVGDCVALLDNQAGNNSARMVGC